MTNLFLERHNYLEETVSLRDELEKGFLVLAERLLKIKNERLYESAYDTFEDFIAELRLSRSTCYKIISVYEKFILLGELNPHEVARFGWGNLSLFTKLIDTKEKAKEVFDQVSPLGRSDALKTLQEMKTGISMTTCQHTWQKICFNECTTCGDRAKIYDAQDTA